MVTAGASTKSKIWAALHMTCQLLNYCFAGSGQQDPGGTRYKETAELSMQNYFIYDPLSYRERPFTAIK